MNIRDDVRLIHEVRQGDTAAFGRVVERSYAALLGAARSYIHTGDDASDAVQKALILAYVHLGQLKDPARLGPWLRQLTINTCRQQALHCLSPETRLTFAPTGETLVTADKNGIVQLWSLAGNPDTASKSTRSLSGLISRHEGNAILSVEFLPFGPTIRVVWRYLAARLEVAFRPTGRKIHEHFTNTRTERPERMRHATDGHHKIAGARLCDLLFRGEKGEPVPSFEDIKAFILELVNMQRWPGLRRMVHFKNGTDTGCVF